MQCGFHTFMDGGYQGVVLPTSISSGPCSAPARRRAPRTRPDSRLCFYLSAAMSYVAFWPCCHGHSRTILYKNWHVRPRTPRRQHPVAQRHLSLFRQLCQLHCLTTPYLLHNCASATPERVNALLYVLAALLLHDSPSRACSVVYAFPRQGRKQ
jgi:hypothetical protein